MKGKQSRPYLGFLKEYALQYLINGKLNEFNARELYNSVSLYIVPMVNPDVLNVLAVIAS